MKMTEYSSSSSCDDILESVTGERSFMVSYSTLPDSPKDLRSRLLKCC